MVYLTDALVMKKKSLVIIKANEQEGNSPVVSRLRLCIEGTEMNGWQGS